ncbi:MAG: hypothetical protein WA005_17700 [Candidatus Binataceae bacterium]
MIKLLRRLFGAAEGEKIDSWAEQPIQTAESLNELRELITNRETRPAVLQTLRELNKREALEGGYRGLLDLLEAQQGTEKGLKALTELAFGKEALAEWIIGRLGSDKDLAPELGGRDANEDERMVLNLWWVTLCVMRAVPKVSAAEKRAFLDQYHEFIYFMGRPDGEDARLAWAVAIKRISALSQTRYQEYFDAFGEMMRGQEALRGDPSLLLVPGAPLTGAIIKNLFGLESDSWMLTFIVQTVVMDGLIAFARTFGTPEAWATMRHLVEEACRALRSGATNS